MSEVASTLDSHTASPSGLIGLAERGLLPDFLVRLGIRRLCTQRLREQQACDSAAAWQRFRKCLDELRQSPVAIHTDAANAQHYELPPRFFELCLGKRLKYSSCYFNDAQASLDAAEEAMLALYAERAQLSDGQHILELGCGWGSLTLWMAEHFPQSRITAVSNSRPQREFIEARCRELGFVIGALAAWGSRHVHKAAAVVSDECGHEVQMRYFCPTCEKRVRGSTVSVGHRPSRKGTRPRRPTR